tara:strand:+ start:3332 stop:5581 length:2250 start_codon:yes stop_codon:yes gene_type:complete
VPRSLSFLLWLTSAVVLGAEQVPAPSSKVLFEAPEEQTQQTTASESRPQSVEQIAKLSRRSAVVIRHGGRAGGEGGTGSGFVISESGLIATCAHVIGESRPLTVHFDDGSEHKVTSIHAWDAKLDLAILQIDLSGKTAEPLRLAPADTISQGAEIVAIGAPHGLEFSVVKGVISALRDFDGRALLQVAIPVEPGNSGGPLLDRQGEVHGLLTMKSAVTDNLGFAVPVGALHRLLANPNSVPMEKWLTIGSLDPNRWRILMGANWKQRAGRITVSSPGDGFGGRSLCLSQREAPGLPYEISVEAKLDDESGAAGLVFESDGGNRHYGFYPSSGSLRLTRFDGPDVFSWNILKQLKSDAYQPGEWNRLRVRIEEKTISCFVNGKKVIQIDDNILRGGHAGLAKFRQTEATFRSFRIGPDLAEEKPPKELVIAIEKQVSRLKKNPDNENTVDRLSKNADLVRPLLRREVESLRARADRLERKSREIHRRSITGQIITSLQGDETQGLFHAALLIAQMDNPELRVNDYHAELERMAAEIAGAIEEKADLPEKVSAIGNYLFKNNGFHGSRSDYYNRSNSYLNEVIDDREGIPITLSLLFMELARLVGVEMHGLPLPGHFATCYESDGKRIIIDSFDGGTVMKSETADALLSDAGMQIDSSLMETATPREIVCRMLRNLQTIAIEEKAFPDALDYVDIVVQIQPNSAQDRLNRALLSLQIDQPGRAKPDLQWILDNQPEGIHLGRIRDLMSRLE